tara:strand:- start:1199 stop:2083 length:885 start_codon:yes stop_codon:yes gene_type:complete
MKLFDCTTFYSEHLMMDIRFNILNEKVHKFVVVESKFSHSGQEKKLNFDIENYKKFKDKIIYLVIENEPENLLKIEKTNDSAGIERSNSLKRIEQSYEVLQKGINEAEENDLILLSDNDEIPNLESIKLKNSKKDILIFRQLFFYYKFNLLNDAMFWYGTKACKKKKLISMPWLRNIKNKKYPLWRLDTFFSNKKYTSLDIVEDGGWHFTNLKSPEDLLEKMKNFGHHNEFDKSGLGLEDIRKKIEKHELFYDHTLDQSSPKKWNSDYKLKKTELNILPKYIRENISNLKDWLA